MYIKIKEIIDKIIAILMLIIFILPMIFIAIAIKIEDRGPIFYKSKRVGKKLKIINVYKFRSMRCDRKELDSNLTHEQMTTKVEKIIRKTSLDELPQLFNILKGEMSFIGPRPWIPEYYEWFTDEQKKRANVLPGISGLAQVRGRNGINVEKKIEYDLEYIENMSFKLDAKLVLETIDQVFSKKNAEISEQGIKEEITELRDNKIRLELMSSLNVERKAI